MPLGSAIQEAPGAPEGLLKALTPLVEHYADLVGVSPEEFLNRFLEEFLVARFADAQTGNAEPFMLSFTLADAGKAQRLADGSPNA